MCNEVFFIALSPPKTIILSAEQGRTLQLTFRQTKQIYWNINSLCGSLLFLSLSLMSLAKVSLAIFFRSMPTASQVWTSQRLLVVFENLSLLLAIVQYFRDISFNTPNKNIIYQIHKSSNITFSVTIIYKMSAKKIHKSMPFWNVV